MNVDITAVAERLPGPRDTVQTAALVPGHEGKGANQAGAVAASPLVAPLRAGLTPPAAFTMVCRAGPVAVTERASQPAIIHLRDYIPAPLPAEQFARRESTR
ncbi:hypothetical protein GCM10011600_29360 [Pseudolysinimonas yzui]|uniref:Uncharacterized protein n=1 Tax=Pseudolysinimonas yzui TaxID=2708254 RepID=A0A8J3GT93_9MICO|nr:hypothetical protein GCM10011600_29360 [Pseudolysinimonas yzui]